MLVLIYVLRFELQSLQQVRPRLLVVLLLLEFLASFFDGIGNINAAVHGLRLKTIHDKGSALFVTFFFTELFR